MISARPRVCALFIVFAARPPDCLVEDAGNLSDCQAYDIDFDECNGAAGGDISRDVRFVVSSAAVAGIFLTVLGFGE